MNESLANTNESLANTGALTDTGALMAPAAIAATAGAVLSLLFNYIPGLNTRFDKLSADMQRAIMGVMILLTAIGMAFWQCSGESANLYSVCSDTGLNWRAVLTNVVFALVGNQSADRISPKPHAGTSTRSSKRAK